MKWTLLYHALWLMRQIGIGVGLVLAGFLVAPGAIATEPSDGYIRPDTTCPTNLADLVPLMLRDLPSYANREIQLARVDTLVADADGESTLAHYPYVLVAGQEDLEPLTLGPGAYDPATSAEPSQVFFTTLERQYAEGKPTTIQQYHWLFLAQSDSGWWFVMQLSRVGAYPEGQPTTAPQDSSDGVIALAIRTWLRDCRSGDIDPLDP
jgi:hypothetical protein